MDFLDRVLERLRAELQAGAPPDDAITRVEAEARQLHGGCKVHVRVKSPRRQERLERALQAGLPLRDAFAHAGVTRSTGFRMLNRKAGR